MQVNKKQICFNVSECDPQHVLNTWLGVEYIVSNDTKTWEEARADCVDRGYNLAKIESEEEHNYIVHVVKNKCMYRDQFRY